MSGVEIEVDSGIPVRLPSGASFLVLTSSEADYINERAKRYLEDNKFVNVSDFQDVDTMLRLELFVHRWSNWLSKGENYLGEPQDVKQLSKQVQEYSQELRQVKKNLGIDKPSRDKVKGEDSVVVYLDNLQRRAKEFGIMRNDQFNKIIELFQELKGLIIYHTNCDLEERKENHVTQEDVLDWIRTVAIPEFDAIDEKFKKEKQQTWIRKQ